MGFTLKGNNLLSLGAEEVEESLFFLNIKDIESFADDFVCYRQIKTVQDASKLGCYTVPD